MPRVVQPGGGGGKMRVRYTARRTRGLVVGGGGVLISGRRIERSQNYKNKYDEGLRWPPFDILPRNNQPKTRGRDGGGMG